jgi:hypothetical protein
MATACTLAAAGWLPITANTSWAQCLELALATLFSSDILPKAIIVEASHLLVSPPHTHPSTTLTPARQYYELPANQPLTAQGLAGYLAVQGFSPTTIPFILYTSSPLALLSTPTTLSSQSNQNTPAPHDDYTANRYFTVSLERTPVSEDISYQSTTIPTYPSPNFNPDPLLAPSPQDDNEDRLLAVLNYYTGLYLCRKCHRPIAHHELAHLEASYQLWCERCARELFTLKREEIHLSPFRRRLNQLYRDQFASQHLSGASSPHHFHSFPPDPFPAVPPLYQARLLAKAASTLVTGTSCQDWDRNWLEDLGNDPWNAA